MPEQIRVYGTSWCPDTARCVHRLRSLGISFAWFDIDQDKKALAFVEQVNSGERSVPTILFPDGSILVEPTDVELDEKLDRKR